MKKLIVTAAIALLRFTLLSSGLMADGTHPQPNPSPEQVAAIVVGKWRYGLFFKVEFMPIDSTGMGRVNAAGKKGVYIPGRCGPGDKGNMLLRTDDEEACVVVQFVDGVQIIKFPPRGSSAAQEVQLHPVK